MQPLQAFPNETQSLRWCMREMAALSALSAVWVHNEPQEIAEGLSVVISRSLPLALVYVRVNGLATTIEVARTPQGPISMSQTQEIGKDLEGLWKTRQSDQAVTIPNPFGSGTLRLTVTPIGGEGECGVLVAGSEQPDFPSQTDRLILSVAANQAAIVLQQKRSEEQLRQREEELTDFFENATVGMHWVGSDGAILRANKAELHLLGYSPDEYIGHHIAEFHANQDVIADILRRLKAGETLQNYEAQMRCKDGSVKHVLIDSSVLWEAGKFIHTRCFTRDITEWKLAEDARRRLAAIVESTDDAIISQDLNGTITSWNRAAERLYGYPAEEIVGKSISVIIPPDHKDDFPTIIERLRRGERIEHYETVRIARGGRRVDVSLTISPLRDAEGKIIGASKIARDITERKQMEAALHERETWLAGEGEALEAALNGAPLETSLGVLVRTATGLLGTDVRAAFYLANPEGTALHHIVGMHPGYADAVDGFPIGPESLSCGLAVHTGQPILTRDVMQEPLWAEWRCLAEKFDFRGCWSIPIHTSARKFTGSLAIYWRQPREATARDVEFVTQVSQAAAIIIARHQEAENRKRAQAAKQKQVERLRLLWEAAAVLLTADSPDTMLHGLFGKIGSHLGVDTYFNFLVNESGDALRLASCDGIPAETARAMTQLEFGQAVCGTVALQRRPIVATHIQESDDPKVQLIKSFGIRSYACNPLIAGDRLLGTLSFASRGRDEFDSEEVAFIETICQYATMAYERLRLLNELKESDRRKDEFLATLAHELRNPLAPVSNAVNVLNHIGSSVPEARWCRDVMQRQVEHLTRLIDDLLDISRITRNKLELRRERIELTEVINSALESSRPLVEQRGHELTISLPPEPIYLNGDLVRLAQTFLNLLNNAAKYTEPGGHISLSAERERGEVMVRVKDTGIGIPPEKMSRLFEMFYQVDHSLEKSHGGLGIGLSLVRRLVELHGGSVKAHSNGAGQGSEFIVRLPVLVEQPQSRPSQELDTNGQPKVSTSRRILVVDDNQDSADSIAMLLQLDGNEVYTAYDGLQGVEAAEQFRPDVVLLDIGMPKLNGEDACRRIRAEAWGKNIMLIALTGWGQEEDRQRCANAGFDHHMTKPVDHDALMKLLDS